MVIPRCDDVGGVLVAWLHNDDTPCFYGCLAFRDSRKHLGSIVSGQEGTIIDTQPVMGRRIIRGLYTSMYRLHKAL